MEKDKKVIVFCDDSPTVRMVVKEELERQGYIIYESSGPMELESMLAKDKHLRDNIDLFVLDLAMPEMMGTQVGSTFPSVFGELERVPFIIYSGEPQERVKAYIEEGYEFFGERFYKNFAGYVEKGERSLKVLVNKVKDVLEKKPVKR